MNGNLLTETNKKFVFLGVGGHSRVLLGILSNAKIEIYGVVSPVVPDGVFNNTRWIADNDIEAIKILESKEVTLINGIGSIKNCAARDEIFNLYSKNGFKFTNVIHAKAIICDDCTIKTGVQIMAGATIQTGVLLDDNVLINTSASIDHDCTIKKSTHIAPGVVLSGNVTVGENCHVGTGARIIQNVYIGNNCLIGAGVTVLDDIPDGTIVSPRKSLVWPYL